MDDDNLFMILTGIKEFYITLKKSETETNKF